MRGSRVEASASHDAVALPESVVAVEGAAKPFPFMRRRGGAGVSAHQSIGIQGAFLLHGLQCPYARAEHVEKRTPRAWFFRNERGGSQIVQALDPW
jgi:hypothetical protein